MVEESRTACFITLLTGEYFTYWVPMNIESFRHNLAQAYTIRLVLPDGTEREFLAHQIKSYTLLEY